MTRWNPLITMATLESETDPLPPPPTSEAPPPSPRWSADHKSWWDGTRWFRLSDDGQFWWDGTSWIPRQAIKPAEADKEGWNVKPLIVIAVLAVVGYIAWHVYVYHNCAFPPSMFAWPSACL
jgi:hypothetical protein